MKLEWDLRELNAFADHLAKSSQFEKQMEKAAKEIAKAVLKWIKGYTPVDGYDLINGWNGNQFAVTKNGDVFEVLIVNTTPYALAVNDGHKAYNQFGGPYPIKRRVQVRSPHKWQQGDATFYVFGHFFVERGIVRFGETKEFETLIMEQLRQWWESV